MPQVFHSCRLSDGVAHVEGNCDLALPWWSFTKTVISVVALRLAAREGLQLDLPLPGCAYSLRDLLRHRSGLPDYGGSMVYQAAVARGDKAWSTARLLAEVPPVPRFAPGRGWAYSNIGYMFARAHIELVAGCDMSVLVDRLIAAPLGLRSVRFATTPDDFRATGALGADVYDPGWVYHGCLIGTPGDAALLLHRVLAGHLLDGESLAQMLAVQPLGGVLPGRPWVQTGYATGLMSGRVKGAGRAIGHSGAGPFSVCAVYHFPDLEPAQTIASFTTGTDEGVAEFQAVKRALSAA